MSAGRAGGGPVPVVHVITRLELGGAQQNTLHTVSSLDRARFRPLLLCGTGGLLDDEARALPDVEVGFLPDLVRPIRPMPDLRARRVLAARLRELARDGPVLVHTHSSKAGILGRQAAADARLGRAAGAARPVRERGAVVHSIHGFGHAAIGNPLVRRAARWLEARQAPRTDAFVSVSRAGAEQARRLGLLGGRPMRVIRSGIDVDAFARADALREGARAELGYDAGTPVLGMIACLKPQKAPAEFVEIVRRVHAARPDARAFLAGDGELRGEVERAVEAAGLSGVLTLLGWRRDVPALLGALDVMLLTSRWEGLPRVGPQAMAAGRPVVATGVDGTPEAIVDGRNGALYAPGDVAGAVARVLALLADPALRARMGAAGRAAVAEFDERAMVAGQEALYDALLEDALD